MNGETNLDVLISTMKPKLNDGEYVFCSLKTGQIDIAPCLFFFKESEGLTIVCPKSHANKMKFKYSSVFSWITLEVHSALEAIGLTAAFSQALANHNIPCNVVAGFYHDHIFVQKERGVEAVKVLEDLATSRNTD